jgi:poly(3-hydroxybutyrate) depolymerase
MHGMTGRTDGGVSTLLKGTVSVGALVLALLATSVQEARAQAAEGGGEGGGRRAAPAPVPSQLGLVRRQLPTQPQRSYSYYVSPKAERGGFTLVVYAIPDNGQSPDDFVRQTGWNKLADDNGFALIVLEPTNGKWAPQTNGETAYLKAVYDDVSGVLTRPGRGAGQPVSPFGTWFPFHYLTGAGEGARLAQAFTMEYPSLYAALATLDGGPFNADYAKGDEPAQNYVQFTHPDKSGIPSVKLLKKDVSVAAWLFTTGAPTPSEARQADYWKKVDKVAPQPVTRTEGGFQTAVYTAPGNASLQVRTTALPAAAKYDPAMASAVWDFFSHRARWNYTPNGEVGSLMTKAEVEKQFVIRPIQVNGQDYVYYLKVPSSYRKGQSLPVVLSAHGGGFQAWLYLSQIKMHEVGEKEGFFTAYLQKVGNNGWNFQDPDGPDSQYIQKTIADIEAEYGADRHRIYMQGFSIGSGLTYMMGVSHPELFAAVAPNSGIGGMSPAVEAKIAQNKAKGLRIPAMILYGDVDTGGSADGKIPSKGVIQVAIEEFKGINHITTPDRIVRYQSDAAPAYDIYVPGAPLVRAAVDARYPAGRFERYQYMSNDPQPLNLFNLVWIKDMAHSQDPREAQYQWNYLKQWRRNDDGSLTLLK